MRAVFEYTRDTIRAFVDANATPEMVQIGNEISNGMLWPDGKLPTTGTISRICCTPGSKASRKGWARRRNRSS